MVKSKTDKPIKDKLDANFKWTNGTTLEKCAFVGTVVSLLVAIVFLVLEFVMPDAGWTYILFDLFIGLAFAGETLTHWRLNRKLAIITGIFSAVFIVLCLLKLTGVILV